MTNATTVLANARLILPDRVLRGALTLADGQIAAITPGEAVPAGAIDCAGDHLAPGLIELHTDNLERHIQPRPGVDWPHAAAFLAHDGELASVGITTVFDALRVGSIGKPGTPSGPYARALSREIAALAGAHFLVEKTVEGDRTGSNVRRLDREGRVEELSRLIGGAGDPESSRRHAANMLDAAQALVRTTRR